MKMEEIAGKLIEFGMDFQYENWGNEGEKITSFSASIEVTIQNGEVYFEYCGDVTTINLSTDSINTVLNLLNEACINETT